MAVLGLCFANVYPGMTLEPKRFGELLRHVIHIDNQHRNPTNKRNAPIWIHICVQRYVQNSFAVIDL